MFSVCDLCLFFFWSKKFVLTKKSKKKGLICVSVYVWDCDLYFYFIFFFFDEGKICINKEEPKKRINKYKLICVSIYDWVCDLCFCGCDLWM